MITPYFYQTQEWADFWLEANAPNHFIHKIDLTSQSGIFTTFIYEYPWFFGESFFYIPEGPILDLNIHTEHFKHFLTDLNKLVQSRKPAFVKLDLDANLTQALDLNIHLKDNQVIKKLVFNQNHTTAFKSIQLSPKRIMYNSTILLDCAQIENIQESDFNRFETASLSNFFTENKGFWSKVNSHTKSRTKKSLNQGWSINLNKSPENFETFWKIYSNTANRQNFSTQPKSYFHTLFTKDFSYLAILNDQQGNPQAVWMGIMSNQSLIYLYGGNNPISLEKYGQYYIHLAILKLCKQIGVEFYDLGGYDPKSGYGVFKERYKGIKIDFAGPYDLVVKPGKYLLINLLIKLRKLIKA